MFARRARNPVFRRRHFFEGVALASGARDVHWLGPDGAQLEGDDSGQPQLSLGMGIPAEASDAVDEEGAALEGRTALLLAGLPNGVGGPDELSPGEVELAFEAGWVPSLSEEERRGGFPGAGSPVGLPIVGGPPGEALILRAPGPLGQARPLHARLPPPRRRTPHGGESPPP